MSFPYLRVPDKAENNKLNLDHDEKSVELDYNKGNYRAPVYKTRRLDQVSGGSNLVIGSGLTNSIFELPAGCVWNFSKSYLQFDFNLDVVVAANIPPNGTINTLFTDCVPIDSIKLLTKSGEVLAEVQQAQIYSKFSQSMAITINEYLSRGPIFGDTEIGNAFPISQITGCQPAALDSVVVEVKNDEEKIQATEDDGTPIANTNIVIPADTFLTNAYVGRGTNELMPIYPSEAYIVDALDGADDSCIPSQRVPNQGSGSDLENRLVQQRLVSSGAEDGANESSLACRYKIPLKTFVGTLLAVNKDLYFGQDLQLHITYKSIDNWGFQAEDNKAEDSIELPGANATITINNYHLYMKQDVNDHNVNMLKEITASEGVSLIIPYTLFNMLPSSAGAGFRQISTPFMEGNNLALKRAITVMANGANSLKRTANTFNVNAVKWSHIQSSLDANRLQDYPLSLTQSEVWNYMYDLISNSPAGMSQRTHEENCFFIDNFSDCYDSTHFYENDVKCSGLPIKKNMSYQVSFDQTATSDPAPLILQYLTCIRLLIIKPDSVAWGIMPTSGLY